MAKVRVARVRVVKVRFGGHFGGEIVGNSRKIPSNYY